MELGINYVIVLNTNAGLWGYNIGDTIRFVNIDPYRIIVTGRIKHFTSAFGEHVIAEEVERSLKLTLEEFPFRINELHLAPQTNPKEGPPHHEWFVEFEGEVSGLEVFSKELDRNLQKLNKYYEDLIKGRVLQTLKITVLKKGSFRSYMKSIGKLGGQNKVPRLIKRQKDCRRIIKI